MDGQPMDPLRVTSRLARTFPTATQVAPVGEWTRLGNGPATPSGLLERSERWRPWRAYAAQPSWTEDATSLHTAEAAHG